MTQPRFLCAVLLIRLIPVGQNLAEIHMDSYVGMWLFDDGKRQVTIFC
jgi:hypothetical protein